MQKIAVIGGGPAGLSFAIEGAEKGLDITLYEKNKIGEKISCAEGFFDTLNLLGKPKYGVRYKVKEIEVQLKSHYSFTCDEKMNIWMLDKGEWLKGLANEARKRGVKIIENCPVNKEMFRKIKTENTWVIDSTGAPSITSMMYGFNHFYCRTSAIAAQYTLEGDFSSLKDAFKIGMEDNFLGYYWIFPKTEKEANVGIGWLESNRGNLWTELDRILQKEGIADYKKLRKSGGLCPVKKLDRLVYDNIILTGDAAGLVSPLHGGGIDTACISAKLAVKSIIENKVNQYESRINTAFGRKLLVEKYLFEQWKASGYHFFERIADAINNNPRRGINYSDLFNGKLKPYTILFMGIPRYISSGSTKKQQNENP